MSINEACGVFGVCDFEMDTILPSLYWGLRSQNHRGHQSYGFITFNGEFHTHKNLGLVPEMVKRDVPSWLNRLPGSVGIGNVRYTTSGGIDEESLINDTQPFLFRMGDEAVAVSYNGNVVNGHGFRRDKRGVVEAHTSDTALICKELLMELIGGKDLASSVNRCMEEIEGAFSVVGLTKRGELFAFKDPHGIKPLCYGCDEDRTKYAFSSESVGLNINGFELTSEVEPGELAVASEEGFVHEKIVECERRALCAFEFAYFSRPDSKLGEKYVYEVREEFGRNLGREYPEIAKKLDVVISIPETGNDAAYGLHEETGIRWERALRRHRYVTERAFILLPDDRRSTIDRKINILSDRIRGREVGVAEDSVVRGDTTKVTVEKLRRMGAKRVHLFITFPRIISPCFYGIDMATYGELIGSRHPPEEIARLIGADTLNYQPIDLFVEATGHRREELCLGCITGEYPTPLAQRMADEMKERFSKGYKETGRIYEATI